MNETKEYIEFLEELSKKIEARYEGTISATITSTLKNNGVVMQGLMLKEEGEQIAPNYYLEQTYLEWKREEHTMDELCNEICSSFEEEKKKNGYLVSNLTFQWEEFRKNVYLRLVNREKNKELLEELPYQEFLDMAIVSYYSVAISKDTVGTMPVKKEHLELLQITEEELWKAARENTKTLRPARLIRMEEIIGTLKTNIEEAKECDKIYVLSNVTQMFGAVSMTFEEELQQCAATIGSSFYILPSSIHEVILVPEKEYFDADCFSDMVREINRTQVEETEVLSDSIYYFDKSLGTIRRIH